MSEPNRLVDECDDALELSLLRAGRRLPNTERRRLRVMGALGIGGAALLGSKTSLAMLSGWKKMMLGAMVTCGGVGSVVAYQQLTQPELPRSEAAVSPSFVVGGPVLSAREPVVPPPPEPPRTEQPTLQAPQVAPPAQPVKPEPEARLAPARTERTKARRVTAEPTAEARPTAPVSIQDAPIEAPQEVPAADPLSEELSLLDRARAALRGSSPAQALVHLQQYERRFPSGRLGFEAEVLKVQVLVASGKRQAASQQAKRLLRRNPNSVAASRLKRYVID